MAEEPAQLQDVRHLLERSSISLEGGGVRVTGTVRAVSSSDKIYIVCPSASDVRQLPVGTPVTAHVQSGAGMFLLRATVEPFDGTDTATLVLSAPAKVAKLQRRDSFRVAMRVPVRFLPLELDRALLEEAATHEELLSTCSDRLNRSGKEGWSADLGGGGMLLATTTPLVAGSYVFVEIDQPSLLVQQFGLIIRSSPVTVRNKTEWRQAIAFVGTTERERSAIFRALFQEAARRKTLGA